MLGTGDWAGLKWRNQQWLMWHSITRRNALEYFFQSIFFEGGPLCLNQAERLGMDVDRSAWTGHEYILVHACDNGNENVPCSIGMPFNWNGQFAIFVIQKLRYMKGRKTPSDVFYILGGSIYPGFSMGDVLRHGLLEAIEVQNNICGELVSLRNWSVINGDRWGDAPTESVTEVPPLEEVPEYVGSAAVIMDCRGRPVAGLVKAVEGYWTSCSATQAQLALDNCNTELPGDPVNRLQLSVPFDALDTVCLDSCLLNDSDAFSDLRRELHKRKSFS